MKKLNFIYLTIVFITIIQIGIILFYKKDLINEDVECIAEVKSVKYIKDIEDEFKNINNSTILSYDKDNQNNWVVKCILSGNKGEVEDSLKKIKNYYVKSYNLLYDKENILLELELTSK